MASGSEDEIEGTWYFGSSQYDPQLSSESEHHLNEILKVKGCNDYVQPYFGKKVEEDNGRLRIQVRIPTQLLREAVAFVNQNRNQQASQIVAENEDVT